MLKGWLTLRRVCHDYGKQYLLRVYALAALAFIYCIASLIFLLLGISQVISFNELSFLVGIFSDLVVVSILFMLIIYQGAIVNSKYKEHIEILRSNKSMISDISQNYEIYFSEKHIPNNYIYRKIIEKLKENRFTDIELYNDLLKKAMHSYDELVYEL
jgi:hypothetical protein